MQKCSYKIDFLKILMHLIAIEFHWLKWQHFAGIDANFKISHEV